MCTVDHVVELQQKHPTQEPMHKHSLRDVVLYDHIKVNIRLRDYWMKQVTVQKYSIVLHKVSPSTIAQWQTKSNVKSWENIDPYSSLEDVGDTMSDELQKDNGEPDTKTELEPTAPIKSRLRKHKPIRCDSGHPAQKASKNISYRNKYEELDLPPTPKRPKRPDVIGKSGPSADRIAACNRKSLPLNVTHPIRMKKL